MKKLRFFAAFLVLLVSICSSETFCQDIVSHFKFETAKSSVLFVNSNLSIEATYDDERKAKAKSNYIFSFLDGRKIDSLKLPKNSRPFLAVDPIFHGNRIYFCSSPTYDINILSSNGRFLSSKNIGIASDSIILYDNSFNRLVFHKWKRYVVQLYDPVSEKIKDVFDFRQYASDLYIEGMEDGEPLGVSNVFSFLTGHKVLIKTGYNEADGSFDCAYYIVDTTAETIEKIPFSHFEPLLAEPRNKLRNVPKIESLDSLSVDIRRMYFDIQDSVGYIPYTFNYDYRRDQNHIESRRYKQDAFVVDRNYNLIGRVLERDINVEYPIYRGGKKEWNVIRSETDSSSSCFFRFKLNYSTEKAFYNLYYDRQMIPSGLKEFDVYELQLLKNFIFAKHNYKFDSQFYQAYFNTFTFYKAEANARVKNVNRLLTAADKENLTILTREIKRKR